MEEGSGVISPHRYRPIVSCVVVDRHGVTFAMKQVKRLTIYETNCGVHEEARPFDWLSPWSPKTISLSDSSDLVEDNVCDL